jgi:hypothetical protein
MSAERTYTPAEGAKLLREYGDEAVKTLVSAGRAISIAAAKRTAEQKLAGQVLTSGGISVRTGKPTTGTLRRDVLASPEAQLRDGANDAEVQARWGTSLDYGIAHEEGFEGTVEVPAHEALRRVRVFEGWSNFIERIEVSPHQRIAEGYANFIKAYSYERRLKKKVWGIGQERRPVKGHSRRMNIPAKFYLKSTLEEGNDLFTRLADSAFEVLARDAKAPTAGVVLRGFSGGA